MKMKIRNMAFALIILLTAASCLKNSDDDIVDPDDGSTTSFEDITVPENFNYSGVKTVTAELAVSDPERLTSYRYVVKVYNADPSKNGKLLITGTLNTDDYTFSQAIKVPSGLNELWVNTYLGDKLVGQKVIPAE